MAFTNSLERRQVIFNGVQEATVEALGIQAKIETRSGVGNELSLHVDEKRQVGQAIMSYVDITSGHLLKLKSHLNTFATINKLPPELLVHIIYFSSLPKGIFRHPYISYTWICRHWRSTLIQDANLWRLVRFESKSSKVNPFIRELVQRSKFALLDIVLTPESYYFMSTFEDLATLMSNRIRRLWVSDCNIAALISGETFSSLRAVQYEGEHDGFSALLSIIVASEHLDTLHYNVAGVLPADARDQLASIFGRIRNLHIEIEIWDDEEDDDDDDGSQMVQITLDLLRNNGAKLQNLSFIIDDAPNLTDGNDAIIFPELQYLEIADLYLMEHFRTPKLSSLVAHCDLPADSNLKEFNLSSIRYLYIIDIPDISRGLPGHIVGFKEASQSSFLTKLSDVLRYVDDTIKACSVQDFMSDPFPRDCFHLGFESETTFISTLASILPRMPNLIDVYLFVQRHNIFTKIVTLVPSLQKLVVRYYLNLEDYINTLRDTSLCPRLKYLSFVTRKPDEPDKNYKNSAVKLLTECLRSRQGTSDNKLEYLSLEISPLPDNWLEELRKLVPTVVIE